MKLDSKYDVGDMVLIKRKIEYGSGKIEFETNVGIIASIHFYKSYIRTKSIIYSMTHNHYQGLVNEDEIVCKLVKYR